MNIKRVQIPFKVFKMQDYERLYPIIMMHGLSFDVDDVDARNGFYRYCSSVDGFKMVDSHMDYTTITIDVFEKMFNTPSFEAQISTSRKIEFKEMIDGRLHSLLTLNYNDSTQEFSISENVIKTYIGTEHIDISRAKALAYKKAISYLEKLLNQI